MDSLLGTTLLGKNGPVNTTDALAGKKAVALYFSAHWCPPCRGFTPQLSEWYTANLQAKGLEVVFVSSDKDEEAFNSYYAEQPWLALPFADRDAKAALSKQFKVNGIPSLVIVDAESGQLITADGRSAVSADPTGEKLPWTPPTKEEKRQMCIEELGDTFVNSSGEEFTKEQRFTKDYIGLYFSAHWCPPCRGFTPQLAKMYSEGLSDKMEIVFLSSDKDEAAFKEYLGEMPWLALPYSKRAAKEALSKAFGVNGIPSFIVLDKDFNLITTDGRSMVGKDPKGENLPEGWLPQPWADCNDDPSALNDSTCVIALGGDAEAAVKEVADFYYSEANKDVDSMKYRFYTAPAGGVEGQLRKLTGVTDNKLIILDIPDDGAFYDAGEDMSAKGIKGAIASFEAKNLTRSQLNN